MGHCSPAVGAVIAITMIVRYRQDPKISFFKNSTPLAQRNEILFGPYAPHSRRRCPGRDGGLKRLRAGCCPLSLPGKGRFTRCSASPLTPMMGRPKADPGENRDPGQGISFKNA